MSRLPSLLPRRRAAAGRMRSRAEIPAPPFSSERSAVPAAVVAEQEWPRLSVWREGSMWRWWVTSPHDVVLDSGWHRTHAEALAVGLAALEQASRSLCSPSPVCWPGRPPSCSQSGS